MIIDYLSAVDENLNKYLIPTLRYEYSSDVTRDYNASTYQEQVNMYELQSIWLSLASKVGMKGPESPRTRSLFFIDADGEITSNYLYFEHTFPDTSYFTVHIYLNTSSHLYWNIHFSTERHITDRGFYQTGYRRASDRENHLAANVLYTYENMYECLCYDPVNNYMNVQEYGSVVSPGHAGLAIERCINIPRSNFGGYHVDAIGDAGTNPYVQAGTSEEGGGFGTFSDFSTDISIEDYAPMPTLSAVDAGFVTLYNPSLLELKNLSSYMWSDLFSLDTLKRIFADPIDAILGLSVVPVAVPDGGSREVSIGNISTGISMNTAASQFVVVDCGVLDIEEFWGSALDYEPNTKFTLYLPYIGYKQIHADDIMGKTIQIIYRVDILTGSCVALVICGGSVLYQYEGVCASQIPVTSNDWRNTLSAIVRTVGTAAGAIGGAGALGAGVSAASVASGLSNTVNSVMGAKPQVHRSGNVSGSGGMLSVQYPYLIKIKPRQSMPEAYNKYGGFPSNISAQLGSLSGFTAIEEIHLENINATDAELDEIVSLLREGVIL